jgi:dTDP-L-rhamnose 4-epimerase
MNSANGLRRLGWKKGKKLRSKVLITGGAGFIGVGVARKLLQAGHQVTILDNFSSQIHGDVTDLPADLRGHVQLIRGDVRDQSIWEKALPGCQVVVNLAAETGTGQSMYEVSRYEQVNLAGTANLYQVLASSPQRIVEKVIVASSRAIYGEGAYWCVKDGMVYPVSRSTSDKAAGHFDPLCPVCSRACVAVPTPEQAPFQPSSFYALTKQVQEQMTLMFGEALGIPSFALRYQNVYGPGQSLKNPYTGILAVFSNLARSGKEINVFEDGLESRDFVYIDDVVRATTACVESNMDGTRALNVGSNERTTVLEVANAVNQFFGGNSKIKISGAFRLGDIRHGVADLSLAKELIRFQPEWKFASGLLEFLRWAAACESNMTGYEHSLKEMRERQLLRGD